MTTNETRRLIVLRHARSEWERRGQGDHERALDERGRQDAAVVGARLRELGWIPQVVTSSDANRTRETWACMREALGGAPTITFTPALYLMGIAEIRAALRELGPEVGTAMVIGHNPGWEDAVQELCGVRARMSPGNAALLQVSCDTWAEAVERRDWVLDQLLRPDVPGGPR